MDVVPHGLVVHPAVLIQLLVVVNGVVELRPDRDHEAAVHLVHISEHLLRIGIARCLEGVVAPRIEFPIVPVLHDVINGNVALAELTQRLHNLLLRLVALAALPEAQHPFRIERGLTRECAIA